MTRTPGRSDRLSPARRDRAIGGDTRRGVPWPFALLAAAGLIFLGLPLFALLERAPWHSLLHILRTEDAGTALRLSLICATASMVTSIVLGVPLAWLLARSRLPGINVIRAVALLPLVLPPVAGGVALIDALGRRGLAGRYLDQWFGISLPFTTTGVVVAETFVAMPFLILTVEGALRGVDTGLEEAAATLGAGRWTVLRRVTLPQIGPSLAAGCVLCWARALGEFGATILFAGSFPGRTETIPIAISLAIEQGPGEATALSVVLLVVSLIILIGLRDKWLRPGPVS
jgi:molybdate transport system permease protein